MRILFIKQSGDCSPIAVLIDHICSFSGRNEKLLSRQNRIPKLLGQERKTCSCDATRLDDLCKSTARSRQTPRLREIRSVILSCVHAIRRFCLRRSCISGAHTLVLPFRTLCSRDFGFHHRSRHIAFVRHIPKAPAVPPFLIALRRPFDPVPSLPQFHHLRLSVCRVRDLLTRPLRFVLPIV